MVGYRPCQLQQPCAVLLLVLLLVRFCCWYCWMEVVLLLVEAGGTSFLVGNSSAAIIVQSDRGPAHGGAAESPADKPGLESDTEQTRLQLKPQGFSAGAGLTLAELATHRPVHQLLHYN